MALARDTVGPNSVGSGVANVSSDSWSHTMSAGADGLIVGCMNYLQVPGSAPSITSMTFNSVGMSGPTARKTEVAGGTGFGFVSEFYTLVAPASGAHTVAVTFAQSGTYGENGTVSYTGADQSTPTGNTNTASSATGTDNGSPTVSSSIGNMVLDSLHRIAGVSGGPSGSQTSAFNGQYFSGYYGAAQDAAGAASVTMTWTWADNTGFTWSGVEIVATGAGGGGGSSIVPIVDRQYRARVAA